LADLFCNAWKSGASWQVQGDGGPHEANLLQLDSSKAKALLGWQPQWDVAIALEKIVEFSKLPTGAEQSSCIEKQIRDYFGST
jgi:CDP-glucose 4,6-dehydratase